MTIINLADYGIALSGREFGTTVFKELRSQLTPPVLLDFKGVESLGSSFGDEVVPPIAKLQGGKIKIANANKIIQKILKDIGHDGDVEIVFVSEE